MYTLRSSRWWVLVFGLFAICLVSSEAADTDRNPKPDPNGLPMILERIRGHAEKDEWKAGAWTDATIEKWLENAAGLATTAAGRKDYKLPVKFEGARPLAAGVRSTLGQSPKLTVGKNVELSHAQNVIVLADGNADVSFADNCIIVARGVVSVGHCNNSLIVSGTAIEISHDGNLGRGERAGSVVLCRGSVDIAHANGTCIVAHEGSTISHASGVALVGGPTAPPRERGIPGDTPNASAKLPPGFPVEPRMPHSMEKKVAVLGAVQPKGIIFRFAGKRYVADLHQPIVNESGEKVAELEKWQLAHVGDEIAVLSDGDVDVPFRLPRN
jgi:hypothetical protein